MRPSTNKEECTIDLTANKIPFSCIVDGNESVTDWQIVIYDIVTNDEVFNSGKITLKSSFYPVDEKNRNVAFQINLKEYLGSNTTFKNRLEAYYWTITLWGKSGISTTSYQEVFYANETPKVSISYKYLTGGDYIALSDKKENNTLISRSCTFKATYEQKDGVQLKRYGWKITDTDSGQVFIDTITNNQIYGSVDNIICNYDGFLNGGNYSVQLFVETQNNTKITTSPIYFSISYNSTFLSNDFKVETLKNEPAIMLDWNKALVISGILRDEDDNIVKVDDTTFKTNYPVQSQCSIEIPNEFKVVYDNEASLNFDIGEDSYISFSTQLLSNKTTELFVAEGHNDMGDTIRRELTYSNGNFKYTIISVVDNEEVRTEVTKEVIKPSPYVWYNILMSPLIELDGGKHTANLEIFEGQVIDCVYPSENLYPKVDFYPTFGKWDNLKEE